MKRLISLICLMLFPLSILYAQDTDLDPLYPTVTLSHYSGITSPTKLTTIEIATQSESVNLNTLDCNGFISEEPTIVFQWDRQMEGSEYAFIFSNFNPNSDAVMYIQTFDPDNDHWNVWCNDDADGTLNSMIVVDEPLTISYVYVWIGSYHPSEQIEGYLHVYQDNPLQTSEASYGSIFNDVSSFGELDYESYCVYLLSSSASAGPIWDEENGDGIGCFIDEGYQRLELNEVCQWQYGMSVYAVQRGGTWECFWRKHDEDTPEIVIAPKPDYTDWIIKD